MSSKKSKKSSTRQNSNSQKRNLFLVSSRLNVPQRKYCKCLMNVRRTKKNPYPICIYSMRSTNRVNYSLKSTKGIKHQFNPARTNCMLNYDFSKFPLTDIQLLAKERKIPITYLNKTKKRVEYKKETLIHKLTTNYLKNVKVKESKKESKKSTKKSTKSK